MLLIKAALSIIALAVIGRSYLRLLPPQSTSWPLPEKWGLSWLIGAGVFGWMANLSLLLAGRVPALLWALFGSVVLVDATIHYRSIWSFRPFRPSISCGPLLSGIRKIPFDPNDTRINVAALASLAFLVLQSIYLAISSLSYTRGWDGAIIWDMKAKAIYFDSGRRPGALMAYLNSPTYIYPHLDYPLLLPSSDAWVYFWTGTANEQALKLIGPAFMISLLALLATHLRRILPTAYALLFACLLTTAPFLCNLSKTGYADIPLAAMAGAAAAYGADYLRRQTSSSALLMSLFTGFAILTKKEGALIAVVMLIAMTLALLFSRKLSDVLKFVLKAACFVSVIAGPWFLFLMIHKIQGVDFAPTTFAVLTANWKRFVEVIAFIPKIMSEKEVFGRFWLVVTVAVLTGAPRWNRPNVIFLGLICFGYLAAISSTFIFSSWNPYWAHVESSLPRLVMHIAPIAVLFAGHSFAEQFFDNHPKQPAISSSFRRT